MRRFFIWFTLVMFCAISAAAEDVPESFLGGIKRPPNSSIENEDPNFPIFPRLGELSSPVKIDYFYSYDCLECAKMSRVIYKLASGGADLVITFHPVARTQEAYDAAVIDNIFYATIPDQFEQFHFGMMAARLSGISVDPVDFAIDLGSSADAGRIDVLVARMRNPQTWLGGIKANEQLFSSFSHAELPILVIGDEKYQGFPGESDVSRLIMTKMGEYLQQRM